MFATLTTVVETFELVKQFVESGSPEESERKPEREIYIERERKTRKNPKKEKRKWI